jgi:ribosomal protein S18 acetylase RimI-like enzyme
MSIILTLASSHLYLYDEKIILMEIFRGLVSMLVNLRELRYSTYRSIISLYRRNPYDHAYLLYDLLYELDNTDLYMDVDVSGRIRAYILIWYGPSSLAIHLWNYSSIFEEVLKKIFSERVKTIIQLYYLRDLDEIIDLLKILNIKFKVEIYLDMFVDEESFKPYNPQEAVRLDPRLHINQFIRLKKVQGVEIDKKSAESIIKKMRYYGVFKDSKLVSIAGRYIALPEIWIIGDVYTHPQYRGLGYGKTVTSAITRDAVISGATAYLHVNKKNNIAINLYKKLGYTILRERPWIFLY